VSGGTASFSTTALAVGDHSITAFYSGDGNFASSTSAALTQTVLQSYTIAVSASPAQGGSVSGAGTFAVGTSRTVTAMASSGYVFSNWTENGSVVSTLSSYTFTLSGNRNLVANFTQVFTIAVGVSPTGAGTVGGGAPSRLAAPRRDGDRQHRLHVHQLDRGRQRRQHIAELCLPAHCKPHPGRQFCPDFTVAVSASPANTGSVSAAAPL